MWWLHEMMLLIWWIIHRRRQNRETFSKQLQMISLSKWNRTSHQEYTLSSSHFNVRSLRPWSPHTPGHFSQPTRREKHHFTGWYLSLVSLLLWVLSRNQHFTNYLAWAKLLLDTQVSPRTMVPAHTPTNTLFPSPTLTWQCEEQANAQLQKRTHSP